MKLIITGIPSKSQPGDFHTVEFDGKKITCDCKRFGVYHMICKHITEEAPKVAMSFLDEIIKLKNK